MAADAGLSKLSIDEGEIMKALAILKEPSEIVELRLLSVQRGSASTTVSGYFAHHGELAKAAKSDGRSARGVYITLNPVEPALLARSANRTQVAGKGFALTSDADILRRRWLPIDLDPVRPSGISSTDEEHGAAIALAFEIRDALLSEEWPDPLIVDSGNGAHLLYRIDVGRHDDELVKRCLSGLACRFDTDRVKVDQGVFNPSRIWKLPGTVSRKGDSTKERPHRMARMLEGNPETVPQDLLIGLAQKSLAKTPQTPNSVSKNQPTSSGRFDLEDWLVKFDVQVEGPSPWNGGRKWILPICPWNPEHRDRSAFVLQLASGALSAGCHHNGCLNKEWADLRTVFEPEAAPYNILPGEVTDPWAPWEPPVPFHRFEIPAFPTDIFPEWLRSFVDATAHASQTPPDLAAMLIVSVLAAAGAKLVCVKVKEGYFEPVNLFTITALPSGNRKSTVFASATKPLEDYERNENASSAPEIARSQTAYRIQESAVKRLQEKASSAEGDSRKKLIKDASDAAEELEGMTVQSQTRYIADDCTPERLSALLASQGGRIALMSPEGDVFELMAGRYSANGAANLGVYLKGHAGDALRVDRVKGTPVFVKAPALTIGLAVQPEIIEGLAQKPGFRGRGLLARFLYAMPESRLGRRDIDAQPVSDEIQEEYSRKITWLLDLTVGRNQQDEPAPNILDLSPEARVAMRDFEAWVEPRLREFCELGAMTDWGGKLLGAVARIAGLLHLAVHAGRGLPWHTPISVETVENAVRLGHYLVAHAKVAFSQMGADQSSARAKLILRFIETKQLGSFTKRDINQNLRSQFRQATDVDGPVSLLVSHGYIRNRQEKKKDGPGRTSSPIYDVNPLWIRDGESE